MVCDPDYEIISINDAYSLPAYAPTQTRAGVHGKPISVIYGYNNTVIIATATNATVNQIYHTSFEDVMVLLFVIKQKQVKKCIEGFLIYL